MSIRKTILAAATLAFTGAYGLSMANDQVITMGFFNLSPHTFVEPGSDTPMGAGIDYFNAHAELMGYSVEWVGPLAFPRLISDLEAGAVDGAVFLSRSPDREEFLHYADRPFVTLNAVLAVNQNHPLQEVTSPEDIRGMTVGFLADSAMGPFMTDNADIVTFDNIAGQNWMEQNIRKLVNERLDAVFDRNSFSIQYEANRLGLADQIRILTLPEPPGLVYAGFSKKSPQGQALVEAFNAVFTDSTLDYDTFLAN